MKIFEQLGNRFKFEYYKLLTETLDLGHAQKIGLCHWTIFG